MAIEPNTLWRHSETGEELIVLEQVSGMGSLTEKELYLVSFGDRTQVMPKELLISEYIDRTEVEDFIQHTHNTLIRVPGGPDELAQQFNFFASQTIEMSRRAMVPYRLLDPTTGNVGYGNTFMNEKDVVGYWERAIALIDTATFPAAEEGQDPVQESIIKVVTVGFISRRRLGITAESELPNFNSAMFYVGPERVAELNHGNTLEFHLVRPPAENQEEAPAAPQTEAE